MRIIQLQTKFAPIAEEHDFKDENHQRHQWFFRFENGMGASVVSDRFDKCELVGSGDFNRPFELATLKYDQANIHDIERAEIVGSVFKMLTANDVERLLQAIREI